MEMVKLLHHTDLMLMVVVVVMMSAGGGKAWENLPTLMVLREVLVEVMNLVASLVFVSV